MYVVYETLETSHGMRQGELLLKYSHNTVFSVITECTVYFQIPKITGTGIYPGIPKLPPTLI